MLEELSHLGHEPLAVLPEGRVGDLRISLSVNGVVRQDSTTGHMIFGISHLVEYLSSGITLSPGDIISTGTPVGVATYSGAPFLKDGDVVECQIEDIGRLRNPVVKER